jgi:MerR family transcriptional regulator, copper efflux regulator
MDMKTLTIGQLAKRAGINLETIRYYERRGILSEPSRRTSGYRQYTPDMVAHIRFIKNAQQLGFSLVEIEKLLALRIDSTACREEVRHEASAKLAEVEEKIRMLEQIQQALIRLVAACEYGGPSSQCPILDALEAQEEQ